MAALQTQQAQLAIELAAAEFKFRQLDTTGSLTLQLQQVLKLADWTWAQFYEGATLKPAERGRLASKLLRHHHQDGDELDTSLGLSDYLNWYQMVRSVMLERQGPVDVKNQEVNQTQLPYGVVPNLDDTHFSTPAQYRTRPASEIGTNPAPSAPSFSTAGQGSEALPLTAPRSPAQPPRSPHQPPRSQTPVVVHTGPGSGRISPSISSYRALSPQGRMSPKFFPPPEIMMGQPSPSDHLSKNGSTSQVASPGMDQSYQAELYDSIPNQSYMSAPNSGKMSAPNSGNRFPTEGRSSLPPAPSSGGREVQNLAEQLDEERSCNKMLRMMHDRMERELNDLKQQQAKPAMSSPGKDTDEQKVLQLQRKIDELVMQHSQALDSKNAQIIKAVRECQDAQETILQLQRQGPHHNEEVEHLQQEMAAKDKRISSLQASLVSLRKIVQKSEENKSNQLPQVSFDHLEAQNAALEKKNAELNERLLQMEIQLTSAQSHHAKMEQQGARQAYDSTATVSNQEKEMLEKKFRETQRLLLEAYSENDEAKSKGAALEQKLRQVVAIAYAERESLVNRCVEQEETIAKLQGLWRTNSTFPSSTSSTSIA